MAAAVAVAAVPLTNWFGASALASGVLALAAPWIRPSTIAAVGHNAQEVGRYGMGPAQYVYLALWLSAAVGAGLLLGRTQRLGEAARFAIVFLILMAIPPLGFEWFKVHPLPQPDRYHLAMEAALAMAAGLVLGSRRRWMIALVSMGLVALLWVQAPRW